MDRGATLPENHDVLGGCETRCAIDRADAALARGGEVRAECPPAVPRESSQTTGQTPGRQLLQPRLPRPLQRADQSPPRLAAREEYRRKSRVSSRSARVPTL